MTGKRSPIVLDDRQRFAWVRLIRSENVGPVAFRALVNRFGGAEPALEALPELAAKGGAKRRITVASQESVEAEFAAARRMEARFVCLGEADYPTALAAAEGAPPVLAMMGEPSVLQRPCLAVVGARNASVNGAKFAATLSREMGREGFTVVSGLARGIDAAAHEASLETGTAGVFAGGLDKPYPNENRPLMRRIVDAGGCLLSEMPFGWTPRAIDFPRRNRIVAGCALGLLVVEAAKRSGSLISARLAGEIGRLVFAVPGSPLDPRAAGPNGLIKDGAILVTETADIVEALRPLDHRMRPGTFAEIGEDDFEPLLEIDETDLRARVLDALGPSPVAVDDLLAHLGSPLGGVQLVLLELTLAGRLERHPGGGVSLIS